MRLDDLPVVIEIETICFDDPWPKSAFRQMLQSSRSYMIAAVDSTDRVMAYLCSVCLGGELQIQNIAVSPLHRRKGLGRLLLGMAEAEGSRRGATDSVLEVRDHNNAALALYHDIGYRQIARRRGYYADPPGDALVLAKRLTQITDSSHGMVS
jgi:ribosomal-protein-alanine N-acetyltransferase